MANEIEKLKVELLDPELVALADKIVQVIEEGKQALSLQLLRIFAPSNKKTEYATFVRELLNEGCCR